MIRAVVYTQSPGSQDLAVAACCPKNQPFRPENEERAQIALAKGRCILLPTEEREEVTGEPLDLVACPLAFGDDRSAAVVIHMTSRIASKQQVVVQQVEWAASWFESMLGQREEMDTDQLVTLVELIASCMEHERFDSAATEVVTELAIRFSCNRVSLGLQGGQSVKVAAVSHSAGFDNRSNLIQDIGEAMHEAMAQNSSLIYPQSKDSFLLTRSHGVLSEEHGVNRIVTIPFMTKGVVSGAVLFEFPSDNSPNKATVDFLEQVVSMIGPVLTVRQRDELWLPKRIVLALKSLFARLFGSGHLPLKVGLGCLVLVLGALIFVSGDYRVTGIARLEARIQRVVVAPRDGYIAAADVRPGDIIQRGEQLGALDDKDLVLEHRKWSAQLEQLRTEYRDALARHDRSKVSIVSARILQAEAQLHLVDEQLSRTRLAAPFDGVIVSGDLSQALGAPVERGQVLYTIAPLDAYRVLLHVDERDIGALRPGQHGSLVLAAMPGKVLPLTVEKITPVSVVEEGRNLFQVEAGIGGEADLLRPGMEGVAKIGIERRRLIWIATHRLIDWLRLTFWSVQP